MVSLEKLSAENANLKQDIKDVKIEELKKGLKPLLKEKEPADAGSFLFPAICRQLIPPQPFKDRLAHTAVFCLVHVFHYTDQLWFCPNSIPVPMACRKRLIEWRPLEFRQVFDCPEIFPDNSHGDVPFVRQLFFMVLSQHNADHVGFRTSCERRR